MEVVIHYLQKLDRHNSIPHWHDNNERKQTKSENISVIFWLEIQTDQSNFKREELLLLYGDGNRQIKDLLSE